MSATTRMVRPAARARRFSCQLPQLGVGLLQPEPHVHLAVHRRRRGQVFPGLLALVRAVAELAEAEVAVGDEGAHAELLGERERVTVAAVSVLRGIVVGGDLTEETEGPRFVAALTALAGKRGVGDIKRSLPALVAQPRGSAGGSRGPPPRYSKRGTKRARTKDLSAKRGTVAKGRAGYTLFLPDGTPVRVAQGPASQAKVPGKVEYPN